VLSVGRLVEKKGHDTLVRAAGVVRDRGVAFRLRIVGEGAEWSLLQRLVHELEVDDQVTFTGPLTEAELLGEYERAQVFALGCRELENGDRDGIPNVLLEAMAHGLPIVSTRCPGIQEAVVDGESALLAEPDDVAGLAARLERLLRDDAVSGRLAANASTRARERFDRDANLPTVVETLLRAGLVHRRRPSPAEGEQERELLPVA
jgi:glycosyltransferase involved in cell wall biosynthesis